VRGIPAKIPMFQQTVFAISTKKCLLFGQETTLSAKACGRFIEYVMHKRAWEAPAVPCPD